MIEKHKRVPILFLNSVCKFDLKLLETKNKNLVTSYHQLRTQTSQTRDSSPSSLPPRYQIKYIFNPLWIDTKPIPNDCVASLSASNLLWIVTQDLLTLCLHHHVLNRNIHNVLLYKLSTRHTIEKGQKKILSNKK